MLVSDFRLWGREEGREEGLEEGRARGVRETILRVLENRFGRVPSELQTALEALTDLERLLDLGGYAGSTPSLADFAERVRQAADAA